MMPRQAGKLIASLYKDDGRNDALLKSFVRESNTKVTEAFRGHERRVRQFHDFVARLATA